MKLVSVVVCFLLFFLLSHISIAEELNQVAPLKDFKYEEINPGSPKYIFKRIDEKIRLFLLPMKKQKASYMSKILERRYRELAYLVTHNEIGDLENVVNRYNSVAGEILDKYKGTDPNLKEQIKDYVGNLEVLRDKFKTHSAQWLLMQYTIDTTRRLSS